MKLFVGLGNPGTKYENTRHNAGFTFIDILQDLIGWDSVYSVSDWKTDKLFESDLSFGKIRMEQKLVFQKPQTFMNSSGRAVKSVINKFDMKAERDLVLIHDDLDIKFGEIKIQRGKRPKKHNGVHSVETAVGAIDFMRVRIGVESRDSENRIPGEDFVLMKMNEEELDILKETCVDSVKELRMMLEL